MDIDDILYRANIDGYREDPTNSHSDIHDRALLCITDLEDCCAAPRRVRGDWYYPDGRTVPTGYPVGPAAYQKNRGPNEILNGRQFYGSVRLWRRYGRPPEGGRFRCELPSAADPNITQTLYANIGESDYKTMCHVILDIAIVQFMTLSRRYIILLSTTHICSAVSLATQQILIQN